MDGLNLKTFNAVIEGSACREIICQQLIEGSDKVMKEASPGKLVLEAKWNKWAPAFKNYLLSAFGVDGVPLSYVIRKMSSLITLESSLTLWINVWLVLLSLAPPSTQISVPSIK